jgi:type IV pilus assembly protein PilQ
MAAAEAAPPAGPAPLPAPVLPEPVPEPQLPERSFDAKTLGPEEKKYTGHPISLDFRDGDLQDIFRLFADISGLNVVVNPGVTGKVTLKLNEVPWDQALELILKTHNLGYTLEDNVIRIAKLSDLQKEEQERRKLQEEKALAGELQVMRRSLSYAKASEMEPTLRKVALSQRGSITLDARTNTMIIQDLPVYLDKARDLINELDRATPQVEIEARIVLTTRTFVRDLGIQWGFSQVQLPNFGNTTDLSFPNSIVINGSPAILGGGILPADNLIGPSRLGYAVSLPAAAFNSGIGVSVGNILGNLAIDAALTALENQGRGRLLSSPKVTTQDNTTAEIEQGVKIPFAIQTVSQTGIPTTTIQFEKAVLNLKVTPQITEANTVILGLELQNDSVDFATTVEGRPAFRLQMAKTTVLVQDGQTAVVGGVFQTREQTNRRSTPFFGDIPILGYLFRGRRIDNENQELLLFLTPRIVKS